MESTGIYHRPIERFFIESNFKVYTINTLYSKMYKRNLRKTKTDKLDCISLAELFFTTDFKQYIKPNVDQVKYNNDYKKIVESLSKKCVSIDDYVKELKKIID